jgi:RarD protein
VRGIALPSAEIALWRAIIASVLLSLVLLIKRQPIKLKKIKKEALLLFCSGAAIGFNWILLFEAYKHTTVSNATLAYYFAPVIVTVACPLLFSERMGGKQWLCFSLSTLGIILITGFSAISGGDQLIGILMGLGAACLYATAVLINKYIKETDDVHRTLLQFISAAIVLTPYVLLTEGIKLPTLAPAGLGLLAVVGLLHTGVAYCLYFSALHVLNGVQVSIFSYIDPVVAVLMSVVVLSEPMSAIQIIGGLLVLGATLYNEIPTRRKNKNEINTDSTR